MERAFSSWPQSAEEPPKQPEDPKDKPKKPRHRHTAVQLAALNELYDKNEHPSLDERTALAERLGMETKTVNAWFQNKRASAKKRHRGAVPPAVELPPISSLLASTSSSKSARAPSEFDDADLHPTLPPPRLERSEAASPDAVKHEPPQQQSAFYAGNPEHRHLYETNSPEMPPRPRMRMRPSPQQTEELRKYYQKNQHPSKEQREAFAKQIGMRSQSVTNWFQNQRSMARKRQEEDAELSSLPSLPDKPKSEGHSHSADSRRYSPYPPASNHPSLRLRSSHPSIATLVHRQTRSPSAPPSNASVSSRASPFRNVPPSQRPRRTRPEPHQLEALQKLYNRTSSPSIDERTALALAVGMDVAKVTNWFRNLRQTARKRAKKPGDDGDTDSVQLNSASVSRGATPSFGSSSSGALEDHDMDTEVDDADADAERMDEDEDESPRRAVHSDAGSDDEYEEAVTPSPEPSPSPPPASLSPATFTAVPRAHRPRMGVDLADPVAYPKAHEPISGVKVEDALLLLGFHQHIVH